MSVNLRQHAMTLVGRPVIAHHVNGTVYRGILHSVTDDGIYIRPLSGTRYVSGKTKDRRFCYADNRKQETLHPEPVFWWWWFIPWAALVALAAITAAAAATWPWWW
ncbi:LSm family protein [Effusibacillus pohliae]|uniref:hypothetical protein n=1 Tax=Effusibacillus pohliae TaxID=232270 RepID=UPI0012E9F90C|nr:hypothetical protein [Effusibacillus pohliae]